MFANVSSQAWGNKTENVRRNCFYLQNLMSRSLYYFLGQYKIGQIFIVHTYGLELKEVSFLNLLQ